MARQFLTPIGLPSGTSNPNSAEEGTLFYRSDLNAIYIYTGTEWVPQADSTTVTNILVEYGILTGDAGTTGTSSFSATISGGNPSTVNFASTYEGGEPDTAF